MFACSQSAGRLHVSTDFWNNFWSIGAMLVAQFFSTLAGIWSGPDAFLGFMSSSSFCTPFVVIFRSWSFPLGGKFNAGISLAFSSVKTDLNCWFKTSALSDGRETVWPEEVRLEIPKTFLFHCSWYSSRRALYYPFLGFLQSHCECIGLMSFPYLSICWAPEILEVWPGGRWPGFFCLVVEFLLFPDCSSDSWVNPGF